MLKMDGVPVLIGICIAISVYYLATVGENISIYEAPIFSQSQSSLFKWSVIILIFIYVIQYLVSLIRKARVEINQDGICDRYTFSQLGLIRWEDISNAEISKGPLGGGIKVTLMRSRQIGIQVTDKLYLRGLKLTPDKMHSVNNYIYSSLH